MALNNVKPLPPGYMNLAGMRKLVFNKLAGKTKFHPEPGGLDLGEVPDQSEE